MYREITALYKSAHDALRYVKAYDEMVKMSKLNDRQYGIIMKDPRKLNLLDRRGLLDKFWKAMPDKTEREIEQTLDIVTEKSEDIYIDENILEFCSEFQDEYMNHSIISSLLSHILRSDILDEDKLNNFLSTLRRDSIGDIIDKYVKTSRGDQNNILRFTHKYRRFVNYVGDKNTPEYKDLLEEIVNTLSSIVYYTNVHSEIRSNFMSNYNEAKKIRDADDFDFLFEMVDDPFLLEPETMMKRPSSRPISSRPPAIRIDYSDEPTAR